MLGVPRQHILGAWETMLHRIDALRRYMCHCSLRCWLVYSSGSAHMLMIQNAIDKPSGGATGSQTQRWAQIKRGPTDMFFFFM